MASNRFPVTRTKIIVPHRRAELLSRQRLLDLLSELLDSKLTIVAAPAGYGKTSLLIDFVSSQIAMPVCWFSLDPLDRNPQRFISHFIAALNLRFPRFGKNSLLALENTALDKLDLDGITSTIINDLYDHVTEHFAIFLDDYHLVSDSKPVEAFVNRFVQDVDENCHIVIASRALLSLPDMPLMVARSQVGGLSFEELAFRAEEMQKLLQQNFMMTVSWSAAQDLVQQTEGWITGLLLSTQITGLPAQDRLRVARVSGVGLYEYLTQQILDQQSPEVQDFLLRTSLLEEFDASLCTKVIGQALSLPDVPWELMMETVTRHNLFILPVGEDGLSLRYHHLFRDFLQACIKRDRKEETRLIQTRLAQLYAGRGDWERAYDLYQRLGQINEVIELIEKASTFMVSSGRLDTLTEWMEALPPNVTPSHPILLSTQGVLALAKGNTSQGISMFSKAIETLRSGHPGEHFRRALMRRAAAYRFSGEYQLAIADADEVLALPAFDQSVIPLEAEAMRAKGIGQYYQGNLKEALVWLENSLNIFQRLDDKRSEAAVSMETGMVYKALGSYDSAETFYAKALDHWQTTGNSIWQANLLNNLGVLQHLQGKFEKAAGSFERAIQHARNGHDPRLEAYALTSIGDLYRDIQATYEAAMAYQQAKQLVQESKDSFLTFYIDLVEASLAQFNSQQTLVDSNFENAFQLAEKSGSEYEINLCRLERARCKMIAGDYALAATDLQDAAPYFKAHGQRVEAAAAHLYLSVVFISDRQDSGQSNLYLNEVFEFLPERTNWQPLISRGIEFRDLLGQIQKTEGSNPKLSDLLNAITDYEANLPTVKRQLRKKVTTVPPAPPRLSIRALGRMQIRINDHPVSSAEWRQIAARDIIFLLLANPNGMNKEQIGQNFWPEASVNELKFRFKNVVYRLRRAVGREVVLFDNDIYRFNRGLDYGYDVESMRNEISHAEKSDNREEKIAHYKAAIRLYKGPYLPEMEGNWVLIERQQLEQIYFDTLLNISSLYLEGEQHQQALKYCHYALDHDPCLEEAHCLAMQIYSAMGNKAAVIRQFEQCQAALKEEMSAVPSEQTRSLYETLI